MDDLSNTIKLLSSSGTAEWNECILTNKLETVSSLTKDDSESKKSISTVLKKLFSLLTGENLPQVKTFLFAKSKKDDSFAEYMPEPELDQSNLSVAEVELLKFEKSLLPESNLIALNTARELLSLLTYYIANGNAHLTKFLPLMAFCDGHVNQRQIYFMLMWPSPQVEGQAVQINTESVSCHGPFPFTTWTADNSQKLSSLGIFQSRNLLSGGKHEVQNVPMDVYAEFAAFGNCSSDASDGVLQVPKTKINVSCSQVGNILSLDTSSITNITLDVSPVPGAIGSPAYCLYQEVAVIEGLLGLFGQDKQVKWTEQSDSNLDVFSGLKEVFASFNKPEKHQSTVGKLENKEKESNEIEVTIISPRTELDFTEKVWDVLKKVGSYEQLRKSIELIWKEIEGGRSCNFWLHADNDTSLAKLIKQSYQDKITPPALLGDLPIRILAEIGMEKLKKDYVNFFFTNRLATVGRIEQFTSFESADSYDKKIMNKFDGLLKLHHLVELAVHCKVTMNLTPAKVLKVVRSALHGYVEGRVDFSKTFSFEVSYNEVEAFVEERQPRLWRVTSKNKLQELCSLCWTNSFPFGDVFYVSHYNDSMNVSNESIEEENGYYYVTMKNRCVHC